MRRLLPRFQINGYCSYIVNVYLILLACNSPILICKLASAAKQLRVVHTNVAQTVTLPFTTPSRSPPRIMATLPKFCSLQCILKLLNYLSLYCVVCVGVCSCCVVCAMRDIFWFSPHRNCDGMRLIALQKHTHSCLLILSWRSWCEYRTMRLEKRVCDWKCHCAEIEVRLGLQWNYLIK